MVTSAPAGTTRPLCGGGRGWSPSAAPRAPSFCVRCKKEAVFVCHADCSHYARVHPKGAAKQLKIGARHHRKPQQPSSTRGTKAALALLGGSTRAATTHSHCTLLQHPAAQQGCPQLTGEIWTLPLHHNHLPSSRHRKAAAVNLLGSQLLTRTGFSLLLVLHADGTRCAEQRAALQEPKPAQRVGRI